MVLMYRCSARAFLYEPALLILLWLQSNAAGDIMDSQYWSEWSLWSSCSAHCEYGISTRTRNCMASPSVRNLTVSSQNSVQVNSTLCSGVYSQTKLCSLKACPSDQPSAHQRSCSQFDSRMFSGKQYSWEPFIHPNDACKMACRAKGIHFYANLPDKAEDGTPCKLGSTDAVCVKGVCKQVGCDGIVESRTTKDICGVCGGDSSSCQTISGIFTSTTLKIGLNYIISIPTGSTNINITELQASRNLLILQTVAGKTLLNEETSNPTSVIVQAAGTAFSYSAKSPSNPRETIFSAGPTNMTVNLKLLMRGSNPGIMYTFNVPNEVSDTVIQQIRHHSQPVELPPEQNTDRHSQPVELPPEQNTDRHSHLQALNSESSELISQNNPISESSSNHPLLGPTHPRFLDNDTLNSNQQMSTVAISNEETPLPSIYELTSVTHERAESVYKQDSDDHSTSDASLASDSVRHAADLSMDTTSHTAATTHHMPGSYTLDSESNIGDSATSSEHSNIDTEVNHLQNVKGNRDEKHLHSQSMKSVGDIPDNDSYINDDNEDGNNKKNTLVNGSSNNVSPLINEIMRSVVNDQKTRLSNESLYSPEDEISQKSVESVKNPVFSAVDTNKTMHLNNDSGNSEHEKKHNSQSSKTANDKLSGSEHTHSDTSVVGELGEETRKKTKKSSQISNVNDNSHVSFEESVLNNKNNSNIPIVDTPGLSRDVDYQENFEKDESLKSHKTRSRYKIPRYSQSFTFADKYKDVYNRNQTNKNSLRPSVRQHNRRRHSHHRNSSQNTADHHNYPASPQNRQYGKNSSDRQQSVIDQNSGRRTERVHSLNSGNIYLDNLQGRDENTDRGNSISELGSFSFVDQNTQDSASDNHQSDRVEEANRERRLRDRQIMEENRRRRIEEQRLRYNERLREYQEMLKQRQTVIDESRRRSSYAVDIPQTADSGRTDESSNHKRMYRYETNPSLSSRDELGRRALDVDVQTPLPPPDRSGIRSQSNGQSSIGNINTFTDTNPRPVKEDSGPSSDTWGQEQLERRTGVNPQTDSSSRRHTVLQPSKSDDDASISNRGIIINQQTYNSARQPSPQDTFSRQTNSPYAPLIREPPRLEYPEFLDGIKINSHSSRYTPGVQQSGPRYIPGSQSGNVVHSALTGPEAQLGVSSNKISSDTFISPSRQPRIANQLGSGDSLPSQISLNTLETDHNTRSIIYEWRISGLTECTHSCGGGVQQTVVVCVDILTQAVVTDENCRHIPKPKLLAVSCNTRPCSAEWTPGPWSSCSVSCGMGEQTRTVVCQARVSPTLNLTMPTSTCESQERISNRQTCSNNPCSSWRVGTWSNCSTPCGDGQKSRDVQCVDLENKVVPDNACLELRPDSEERCNLGECGKGWFFTEWPTECPVECGTGEVTRQVFCADDTGSALPDSRCDIIQRPAVSQQCRVTRPCGGLWFTGQWSSCQGKCGSGNRRRDVLCIKELPGAVHAVVDEENCQGSDKPSETEPCQGPPCRSEWYMTSWSQCSQSCGTGYRTREVKCLDPDQKLQDDCPLDTRPRTKDACNTDECVDVETEQTEGDSTCVDKFAQCKVVKRARLCRYGYYKTICCKSCADDT